LLVLAGFGGVTYGSWLIYEPAAFILAGALLLVAGLRGARSISRAQ